MNFDAGSDPSAFISATDKNTYKDLNSVFPNPFVDELTLNLNDNFSGNNHLSVHNILGELVIEQTFSGKKHVVDLNAAPRGVYFITCKGKQGSFVKKIVKE
jgi:hypothetical protein